MLLIALLRVHRQVSLDRLVEPLVDEALHDRGPRRAERRDRDRDDTGVGHVVTPDAGDAARVLLGGRLGEVLLVLAAWAADERESVGVERRQPRLGQRDRAIRRQDELEVTGDRGSGGGR